MTTTRLAERSTVTRASAPRMQLRELECASREDTGTALDVNVVLTLRSDARYLSLIRGVTKDVCAHLGLSSDATDGVKLAVGEAVANAMEHGSPDGKDNSVVVIFNKCDGSLTVEVIDQGDGICFPINRRRCRQRNRGFGITLMRSLMDTVEYVQADKGTHLVMTKRLPS